jgi:hypothetical protein
MRDQLRCRWVRARLPLLAGQELMGFERRQVERHLISCGDCRQRRAALANTLEILHAAGAESPTSAEASSLWPALALQIRESRRPVSSPDLGSFSFSLGGLRLGLGPALLGLSLTLGALIVFGLGVVARPSRIPSQPGAIAKATRPPASKIRALVAAPKPKQKPPAPKRDLPPRVIEAPVVEASPPRSLDYDLEHGRPMPTDGPREARETRSTTY